jgi:hypothetical protein
MMMLVKASKQAEVSWIHPRGPHHRWFCVRPISNQAGVLASLLMGLRLKPLFLNSESVMMMSCIFTPVSFLRNPYDS